MYYIQISINNPSTSLIEFICKESTVSNTNEKNAITQYTEFQRNQGHQNFKVPK